MKPSEIIELRKKILEIQKDKIRFEGSWEEGGIEGYEEAADEIIKLLDDRVIGLKDNCTFSDDYCPFEFKCLKNEICKYDSKTIKKDDKKSNKKRR